MLHEIPAGPIRARALARLARVRGDDFQLSVSLLREALANVGDDHRMRAQIEQKLADNSTNIGDFDGQLEHAKAAVTSAERAGDRGLLAVALAQLGDATASNGQGIDHDLFSRAIELERFAEGTDTFILPSTVLGSLLRHLDQFDDARPLLEHALRRAQRRGEESTRALLLCRLAHLEWDAGNPQAADRHAADAAKAARQQADAELDCWVAYVEGRLAAGHGELPQARTKIEIALELATHSGNDLFVTWATIPLAQLELWTGHPESAHTRLQPLLDPSRSSGLAFRLVGNMKLPLWSADIEALITTGQLNQAQLVLEHLRETTRAEGNPHVLAIAYRCEGLLLAAAGDLAGAIEKMDAALIEHARRPVPLAIGRTLLEKGTIQRRAKHKNAAKHTITDALAILEPMTTSPGKTGSLGIIVGGFMRTLVRMGVSG
ncbi:MAG: tetratricopeptide repeat protein [Solirubrobacteraceae bacterium]